LSGESTIACLAVIPLSPMMERVHVGVGARLARERFLACLAFRPVTEGVHVLITCFLTVESTITDVTSERPRVVRRVNVLVSSILGIECAVALTAAVGVGHAWKEAPPPEGGVKANERIVARER